MMASSCPRYLLMRSCTTENDSAGLSSPYRMSTSCIFGYFALTRAFIAAIQEFWLNAPGSALTTAKRALFPACSATRSEEHTSELQSQSNLVCRLLLEKKYKG